MSKVHFVRNDRRTVVTTRLNASEMKDFKKAKSTWLVSVAMYQMPRC
jgi:hypothetical protein